MHDRPAVDWKARHAGGGGSVAACAGGDGGSGRARYNVAMAGAAHEEVVAKYQYKAGRYSSHTLLLAHFPEGGEGRRVLDIGCAAGYLSEILVERGYSVACIDWP